MSLDLPIAVRPDRVSEVVKAIIAEADKLSAITLDPTTLSSTEQWSTSQYAASWVGSLNTSLSEVKAFRDSTASTLYTFAVRIQETAQSVGENVDTETAARLDLIRQDLSL